MEKALEILEKNVQWLVLGLAGLFLAWVAYAYIMTPPAQVKIGPKVVLPADIATFTADGVAKKIDSKIKNDRADFPTPDLVASWQSHMVEPMLATNFNKDYALPMPASETAIIKGPGPGKVHVASLPVLPKAVPAPTVQTGLSVVTLPAASGAAPAAPDPNVPVAQQPRDVKWVTVSATIPAKPLSDAILAPLKGQPLDPQFYNTQLLQVVMQRQQAIGVDAKGDAIFPPADDKKSIEEVPALVIDPTQVLPMPAAKDGPDIQYKYLEWAGQHVDLIATPPFYQVVAGDPWVPPVSAANGQTPLPGGAAPGVAPAPASAPAPANGTAPAPATPPATPPAGAMKSSLRQPGQATASYAPFDPHNPAGGNFPMTPGGLRPGMAPMPFNPVPNAGNVNATGPLNPFAIQNDIQIYGTDENVKPGQSYRYRFIYKMKNPVFAIKLMADDKLVEQFALVSPPSDWSPVVRVPDTTKYWVASISRMDQAKMDVFQWSGGQWSVKHLTMSPGDLVPGTDATVVDIRAADSRQPPRDRYVLLTTEDGKMQVHNATADAADNDYQTLLNQVNGGGIAPNGTNVPPPPIAPPIAPRRPARTSSGAPSR
jgi:hypothetical protein